MRPAPVDPCLRPVLLGAGLLGSIDNWKVDEAMKAFYVVRRHKPLPDMYQPSHRLIVRYSNDYQIIDTYTDPEPANMKVDELKQRMGKRFKYSIGRIAL